MKKHSARAHDALVNAVYDGGRAAAARGCRQLESGACCMVARGGAPVAGSGARVAASGARLAAHAWACSWYLWGGNSTETNPSVATETRATCGCLRRSTCDTGGGVRQREMERRGGMRLWGAGERVARRAYTFGGVRERMGVRVE